MKKGFIRICSLFIAKCWSNFYALVVVLKIQSFFIVSGLHESFNPTFILTKIPTQKQILLGLLIREFEWIGELEKNI